jgi:hypothetical protein
MNPVLSRSAGSMPPYLKFELGSNFEPASHFDLPLSAFYQLAASSTPPEIIKGVIEQVKAGEKLAGADVKKAVQDAKQPRRSSQPSPSRDGLDANPPPSEPSCLQGLPDDDEAREAAIEEVKTKGAEEENNSSQGRH